jgi:primosomal protein N' (replication factor Y) (superfamily II helicase)
MSKPNKLIDVAIPIPVDSVFTYAVPEALSSRTLFGRGVLVPFRNKFLAGFIVGYPDPGSGPEGLKEVLDIPDEPPYLTEPLWHFIRWVADYYLLPLGLVLRTALPPGSKRKSRSWAVLTPQGRMVVRAGRDSAASRLPANMMRTGFMLSNELQEALGAENWDEAVRKNWIRIEERIARPRASLRRKRLVELLDPAGSGNPVKDPPLTLTAGQHTAVETIREATAQGGFQPFLLFGVTGSGKTEVYLRMIEDCLERHERAMVLVPEIALTPQLARRFLKRIGSGVGLFHSGLTPAQRLDEWRRMISGKVDVLIGARSGIFAPLENLGLIVVDEEHDPSYKQEDSCPYNARDMALARAKLEGARIILGSATPSFETFLNAQKGKITRLDLPSRHHGGELPRVTLVDLKSAMGKRDRAFLTPPLVEAVGQTLSAGEQVVLFLNRRGFDTFAQCRSCGYVFKCPNCDISLTHHKSARLLKCHLCGLAQAAPPLCPSCSGEKLFFGGVGTQKVAEELVTLFPDARIERLDRDSTRQRHSLESILDRFRNKEIDILVGTQMIVKGHDFPGISLVGVLCGDLSLHFPDFRAAERTFQMLTQVAGRTGRESDSGRVILQTFDPEHEAIQCAASHAYERFFSMESALREELLYPPFGHLILIRIEGNSEKRVEAKAVEIGREARRLKARHTEVMILGPAPAPRKKVIGRYRWQILLKAATRSPVRDLVKELQAGGILKSRGQKIVIDVDPIDLI